VSAHSASRGAGRRDARVWARLSHDTLQRIRWETNPDRDQLATGDQLDVVYDANDPSVSCACDPRQLAQAAQWWRRLIAGLFVGAVIALIITRAIQRRFAPNAPATPPASAG
jgi:hypothetical protein